MSDDVDDNGDESALGGEFALGGESGGGGELGESGGVVKGEDGGDIVLTLCDLVRGARVLNICVQSVPG